LPVAFLLSGGEKARMRGALLCRSCAHVGNRSRTISCAKQKYLYNDRN
jgi:hypothetical protein